MLKIYAISTVKETQQTWAEEDDFQVEKPSLKIEVSDLFCVIINFVLKFIIIIKYNVIILLSIHIYV